MAPDTRCTYTPLTPWLRLGRSVEREKAAQTARHHKRGPGNGSNSSPGMMVADSKPRKRFHDDGIIQVGPTDQQDDVPIPAL